MMYEMTLHEMMRTLRASLFADDVQTFRLLFSQSKDDLNNKALEELYVLSVQRSFRPADFAGAPSITETIVECITENPDLRPLVEKSLTWFNAEIAANDMTISGVSHGRSAAEMNVIRRLALEHATILNSRPVFEPRQGDVLVLGGQK